jgi:hypothetical protein
MKMFMFPIVWALTLTLALPVHQPSSAAANSCCQQTVRCRRTHNLTALQMQALDEVAAKVDSVPLSPRQTGGAAPDIVID